MQEVDATYIKNVRAKYGLTQKAFAKILGIGEASIIRYEQGQKPTKAIANLIRAADMPAFMADCLERNGDAIAPTQRENAEKIVYATINFNEEGKPMNINEIYELTLEQEILNEKAALIIGDAFRGLQKAREEGDAVSEAIFEDVMKEVAKAKHRITAPETNSRMKLAEISGWIQGLESLIRFDSAKVA